MKNKEKIEIIVNNYLALGLSFTSVDISNDFKRSGDWIRNSEVSTILKDIINKTKSDYIMSNIKVKRAEDNNEVTAILYHLRTKSSQEYTNLEGKPMKPEDIIKSRKSRIKKYKDKFSKEIKELKEKKKSPVKKSTATEKLKVENKKETTQKKPLINQNKSTRDYSLFNFINVKQ